MKFLLIFLFFASLLPACDSGNEKSVSKTEKNKSPDKKDSLAPNNEKEIHQRDSLLGYFDFVKSDLPSFSYYNKAWWKHYWLREHILMAGVDSTGNYFLTMTTFFPPGAKTNHTDTVEVLVYTKSDSVITNSSLETDTLLLKYEKQNIFIGTWNPEFHVYDQNASKDVMEFISSHRNENMHFILICKGKKYDGPHSVGKRSRMAISQCYELGTLLIEQKKIGSHPK